MRNPTIVVARSVEPGGSPSVFSLRRLFHVVFKYKWLILLVFVPVAAGAGFAAIHFTVPKYLATAQLLVVPDDVRLPIDDGNLARAGAPDEQIARTIQLLTGRALAEDVVQAVGPAVLYRRQVEDRWRDLEPQVLRRVAASELMNNLDVGSAGRSSIIYLSFVHEDAYLAAKVVNLLGELYADRHLRVQKNTKADAFFEDQLVLLKQKLADSRRALEAFRVRNGISAASPSDELAAASAQLASARGALAEARSAQSVLQSRIDSLSRRLAADARIPLPYYRIRDRLTALEAQESELASGVTGEHPTLRELRDQIRSLREQLASYGAPPPFSTSAEQDQFQASAQLDLARAQAERGAVRARQKDLAAAVDAAQRRLTALESVDGEFKQLQQQVLADEETYRRYLARVEGSRMVQALGDEKIVGVRVIEPALAPLTPLDSRLRLKILLGVLAGGAAGLGAAFLLHFVGGRLDTRDDVERALGLPVLASIGELKQRSSAALR